MQIEICHFVVTVERADICILYISLMSFRFFSTASLAISVFFLFFLQDCLATFHNLVKLHFKGYLKPPFNIEGRKTAGMTEEVSVILL